MSRAPADDAEDSEGQADVAVADLAQPLRRRIASMAADALGRLGEEELPPAFRRLARFAPAPRARHANPTLLVALEDDPSLRQRIATQVRERYAWTAQVDDGEAPDGVDDQGVAAAAWLLRPDGWAELVRASSMTSVVAVPQPVDDGEAARIREQLVEARKETKRVQAEARTEAETLRRDLAEARRLQREETRRRERADAAAAEQAALTARQRGTDERRLSDAEADKRRLRSRLRDAEIALEQARRAEREGRSSADTRARLLLDTVVEAAQSLRRELGLPPTTGRPADVVVAAGGAVEPTAREVQDREARARDDDDPALLETLLSLPYAHLVVDGYNVTKEGYGGLTLEDQRTRLTGGLVGLTARTGVEATVVFDGAVVESWVGAAPRGVRVLFSPPGESADEVIRRLVRAEPPGRPVIVISSDREVADGITEAGARAMPSRTLLRLLSRS